MFAQVNRWQKVDGLKILLQVIVFLSIPRLAPAQTMLTPATESAGRDNPLLVGTRDVRPPFGLDWGDDTTKIINWAETRRFKLTAEPLPEDKTLITVIGNFKGAEFTALAFIFQNARLVGVEIQYEADDPKLQSLFHDALVRTNKLYGAGKEIENVREAKTDIDERRRVYQWDKGACSVRLIDFSAKNEKDSYHKVSLHYENRGLARAIKLEESGRLAIPTDGTAP